MFNACVIELHNFPIRNNKTLYRKTCRPKEKQFNSNSTTVVDCTREVDEHVSRTTVPKKMITRTMAHSNRTVSPLTHLSPTCSRSSGEDGRQPVAPSVAADK